MQRDQDIPTTPGAVGETAVPQLAGVISKLAPMRDPRLRSVASKLAAGERLDADDGLTLFKTHDVMGLGRLANAVKGARTGPFVTFVLNRQINPTNVCVLPCKFCDFATKIGDDDAYEMSMAQILEKVDPEKNPIREVHIVGGLHPSWPFEYYEEMLREIRRVNPTVQIKAFTAVEMDFFANIAKISLDEVFERLQAAGLQTMPGGGAEVFSERVREEMYREKIGHERWLEVHDAAHRRGIRTNATLLYGHIETYEERVNHMLMLREHQDRTGGFLSFIPLAFQPGYTNIVDRQASAIEDLRTIAAARLMLDNFPHIKAYWVMLGEESASMALQWGADDLDGTIGEEKIAHAALASSPVGMTTRELVKLIREAGRLPVQRDATYRVIAVYPPPGPATHWSQRTAAPIRAALTNGSAASIASGSNGGGQAIEDRQPITLRGEIAEPAAVDVTEHGLHTWSLMDDAGRAARELASSAPGGAPGLAEPPPLPQSGDGERAEKSPMAAGP